MLLAVDDDDADDDEAGGPPPSEPPKPPAGGPTANARTAARLQIAVAETRSFMTTAAGVLEGDDDGRRRGAATGLGFAISQKRRRRGGGKLSTFIFYWGWNISRWRCGTKKNPDGCRSTAVDLQRDGRVVLGCCVDCCAAAAQAEDQRSAAIHASSSG
jgi:hypothetical protein